MESVSKAFVYIKGILESISRAGKALSGWSRTVTPVQQPSCVFIDEKGCNTNMTRDKQVGGRNYITSTGQVEGARAGTKSDLHFTVLAFTSGTGEVIMCSVIMKSENCQKEIPLSWCWGIDMSKNLETGKTEVETWDLNCENEVCKGGPVCFFKV